MSDETIKFTADLVLIAHPDDGVDDEPQVLLIRRGSDPYAGHMALPGGHVDTGEDADVAAVRELHEETGIVVSTELDTVGAYHAPGRDPRGRYVSVAYLAVVDGLSLPTAADDAATAEWMPIRRMIHEPQLAFDHQRIIADAWELYQRQVSPDSTHVTNVVSGGVVGIQAHTVTGQHWS